MEERITVVPTVGWDLLGIEGKMLIALRLIYRSDPHNKSVVSQSTGFAMSPEQMRQLAAALVSGAEAMESDGKPATGTGRH